MIHRDPDRYTEYKDILRGALETSSGRWRWTPFANLPSGLTHAAAAIVDGVLYVMGGYGVGPCAYSPYRNRKCAHRSNLAVDLQNPLRGAERRAPMRYNRSNFGIAALGGRIFTAGGYGNFGVDDDYRFRGATGCVFDTLDVYDPVTDAWASLPAMATARGATALAAVTGPAFPRGVLVAAGGFYCTDGPAHTRSIGTVEAYDVSAGEWRPAGAMPGGPTALAVPVQLNATAFVLVGGFNGTSGGDMNPADLLRPIYVARMSADGGAVAWVRIASMPWSRGFPAAALAPDGRLLVVGGYDAVSHNDSALVQALVLDTNSWERGCSPPL